MGLAEFPRKVLFLQLNACYNNDSDTNMHGKLLLKRYAGWTQGTGLNRKVKKYMIRPDKVREEAKKREKENFKFRTFLKCHADEDELDSQFLRLHRELFAHYDCSKCRNCCKMYKGSIPAEDIGRDAQYLGISPEQFIHTYLEKEEFGMNYQTKHKPCDFMQEDGSCKLGDCKPDSCKKYPYTDQPERLSSLLSIIDTIEICPIAFEIFERLKQEYRFRTRR